MRRILALLAALLLALGLAGCGDDDDSATTATDQVSTTTTTEAATTTTTEAAVPAAVAVATTDLGEVLVNADGMTLYLFKPDSEATSACTEGCAQAWPPLVVDGVPAGGDGVDPALLATAARDDGSAQVTYNGHRLYVFSGDAAPGDTKGQGVADVWFAVTAAGEQAAA